jgi:hypothetical protein
MMRRGFWLVTGAVLGVTGYRKAARLARTITGAPVPSRSVAPGPRAEPSAPRAVPSGSPAVSPASRAVLPAPLALPAARPAVLPASRALGLAALRQVRSAASFARDVRDGMADYRDLHGGQLGRSLGSQPGRAASGRGKQGRIEP